MVRADPDVIMVGEIRDRETAQIAIESALTGHLVLSTLHTNDAPSAITRLIEMGVEPFLVASALECVVAQRLARMLCPNCKRRTIIPAKVLQENGYKALMELEAYEPVGCRRCGGSGYRGRVGLYEVMNDVPGDPDAGARTPPAEEIRDVAVRQGMVRLRDDGLQKVRHGTHLDGRDRARHRQQLSRDAARNFSSSRRLPLLETRFCAADRAAMDIDFADLLMEVVNRRASDLHLSSGAHPTVRVRGRLTPLEEYPKLSSTDTREIVYSILTGDQRQRLETNWQLDFAYSIPGHARFRVNAYYQRGAIGAAFRLIPFGLTSIDELGLPAGGARVRAQPARLRARHGPDRLGQVHLAGGDDR